MTSTKVRVQQSDSERGLREEASKGKEGTLKTVRSLWGIHKTKQTIKNTVIKEPIDLKYFETKILHK